MTDIPESLKIAAHEEINKLLNQARDLISKAETIADRCGIKFHWEGPSWNMGGTYDPAPMDEIWDSSTVSCMRDGDGWTPDKEDQ